jgi:hypothetical protein
VIPRRAAAALAGAVMAALPACGGDDEDRGGGQLRWVGAPRVFEASPPARDRVLRGTIRNVALRRLDLRASQVELLDARGERVPGANAVFLQAFVRGRYAGNRPEDAPPERDLRLAGRLARLEPGRTLSLTVTWRARRGRAAPTRIELGGAGTLPVPTR